MKKTTIIAIFLVYLASILIVQFFGLQVVEMQGKEYVSEIVVQSLQLTNRTAEQNQEVKLLQEDDPSIDFCYAFKFIRGDEPYTADAESIAQNPNRIKINYEVKPYNAADKTVRFVYENSNVIFLEETNEFVFLKKSGVTMNMRANDASQVSLTLQIIPVY